MSIIYSLALILLAIVAFPSMALAEWVTLSGVRLAASPFNDGDSFRVVTADSEFTVRLYAVDCPETEAATDAEMRRIRDQTRHFGLSDNLRTVSFAREAAAFTAAALTEPFTVHTTLAQAPSRSAEGRFFAFVTTADGQDLGERLVSNGLARALGVVRAGPGGTPRDELTARLEDLEQAAMLSRIGIWADSDAERLVAARSEMRREWRAMNEMRAELNALTSPVKINSAPTHDLQLLPGVGPVLADRIAAARPFSSVDELKRVKGIGRMTFERVRELIVCD
jgi:endonuclease YncB( thermonuclease family)